MSSSAFSAIRDRLSKKRDEKAAREAERLMIDRHIEILKAEIAAFDEALRLITSDTSGHERASQEIISDVDDQSVRRRGPKGAWKFVMPEMVRQYPTGIFTVDDVVAAGDIVGFKLNHATARSQMANYVNSEWLDRVSAGRFRFTKIGIDALASLSNLPDNAVGDPETESPAVDDVQAAGELSDGPTHPEASNVSQHTVGGDVPR